MKDSKATAGRAAVRREREAVAEVERKVPLRRRLLEAIGAAPSTPTELGKAVGATKESVSRSLAEMREEGLVIAERESDDRRRSVYSLTVEGRSQLGRHLAFGRPKDVPPPPDHEESVRFLREALAAAVAMRRRTNRLQDAIDRIEEVRVQALELKVEDVALEALGELATTQRQDRQTEPLERSLEIFEEIALGTPDVSANLVFPAIAQLEYERGRFGEQRGEDAGAMAQHLTAAMSLFGQLTEHRPTADTRNWRTRQAWSVVSLAGNLRRQSQYEESLRYAALALQMFDDLEDDYGRTQCWYSFGFCLRLLRRFDEAWSCLDRAHRIAADRGNSFERAQSSCLVQMGDVRRHQGSTAEAREILGDAVDLADRMDLLLTKAFATSAIGAVEYQERKFEQARVTLASAQDFFERCLHDEGKALNARRQVTVARRLSFEGFKLSVLESRAIKELLRLAETTYRAMGSPAGVAACEVERGWMRKRAPNCGKLEPVIRRLSQILDDDRERQSLKRDAWLPGVLRAFAKEVDGDLATQAGKVYLDAQKLLEVSGNQGVECVSEAAGRRFRATHESRPSKLAIEMGGESRLKEQPLALPAAA